MILGAGDIRQEGDQTRVRDLGHTRECYGLITRSGSTPFRDGIDPVHWHEVTPERPGCWTKVNLVGHAILQSDLMHAEFRRGE
jgi:hypothetical protein